MLLPRRVQFVLRYHQRFIRFQRFTRSQRCLLKTSPFLYRDTMTSAVTQCPGGITAVNTPYSTGLLTTAGQATLTTITYHRRSQGVCSGYTCTPRAMKKNFFRPNLQEKCESAPPQDTKCTPQPEQESIFRSFCWVVKKCTPADKILPIPMMFS